MDQEVLQQQIFLLQTDSESIVFTKQSAIDPGQTNLEKNKTTETPIFSEI